MQCWLFPQQLPKLWSAGLVLMWLVYRPQTLAVTAEGSFSYSTLGCSRTGQYCEPPYGHWPRAEQKWDQPQPYPTDQRHCASSQADKATTLPQHRDPWWHPRLAAPKQGCCKALVAQMGSQWEHLSHLTQGCPLCPRVVWATRGHWNLSERRDAQPPAESRLWLMPPLSPNYIFR